MLYRNLNNDLTEESSWVFIGQMLNQGASLHMMYVETTAEEGGLVNPVYAIGGVDAYGNSIDFSDWEQSALFARIGKILKCNSSCMIHPNHSKQVVGLRVENHQLSRILNLTITR